MPFEELDPSQSPIVRRLGAAEVNYLPVAHLSDTARALLMTNADVRRTDTDGLQLRFAIELADTAIALAGTAIEGARVNGITFPEHGFRSGTRGGVPVIEVSEDPVQGRPLNDVPVLNTADSAAVRQHALRLQDTLLGSVYSAGNNTPILEGIADVGTLRLVPAGIKQGSEVVVTGISPITTDPSDVVHYPVAVVETVLDTSEILRRGIHHVEGQPDNSTNIIGPPEHRDYTILDRVGRDRPDAVHATMQALHSTYITGQPMSLDEREDIISRWRS